MSELTLQAIKKHCGLTNAAIGKMLGCSASTVGMILQGRHIHVFHDEQIQCLADILGITFERCWLAMVASYEQFVGRSGQEIQRVDEVKAQAQANLGFPVDEPRAWTVVESQSRIGKEIENS